MLGATDVYLLALKQIESVEETLRLLVPTTLLSKSYAIRSVKVNHFVNIAPLLFPPPPPNHPPPQDNNVLRCFLQRKEMKGKMSLQREKKRKEINYYNDSIHNRVR